MTCLISKNDYFQVLSMVRSIFIRISEWEEAYRNTALFVVWRVRDTPEVKIASVPIRAVTGRRF